jgi:DNA-binding GntR family transcriptional regulator
MLLLTLEGITPLMFDLRRRAWAGWAASGHGVEPLVEAHAAILERIRMRDSEGAATAMTEHLAQARIGLLVPPVPTPAASPTSLRR